MIVEARNVFHRAAAREAIRTPHHPIHAEGARAVL